MHLVIFAGGAGTRLWPLSRRNSPKQFGKFKDDRSTLQLAVERVREFGLDNVYISTAKQYRPLVAEQAPDIAPDHILTEPARRDLAAAVCLTLLRLKHLGVTGTIAMLWADHFMERPQEFVKALKTAAGLIEENPKRFIFLAEQPRFANHNLGWIHLGYETEPGQYEFRGWRYRPTLEECEAMYRSGAWRWNPGYFVFNLDFALSLYGELQPELYGALAEMLEDPVRLEKEYAGLPAQSFDNAIAEKIAPEQAVVLKVDLGWSDPGTLYALKEALADGPEANYTKGSVLAHESTDCFFYNEETDKLVTAVGLRGIVVVNTKDALLVCHKDHVPDIKELLKKMENGGFAEYL